MTELTGVWAQKLADWGIDPNKVVADVDEEPGEAVCRCDENGCAGQWRIVARDEAIVEVRCDECGFEAGIPAVRIDARLRRRRLLEHAELPARFVGLVFDEDDTNRDALAVLRSWLEEYAKGDPLPAPAIWGEAGRGKTHLLTGLCTRLIREQDASVMFRSVRALLRELQRFDDETERSRTWHRAVSVDVLALDDVGAEQVTDWRADQIAHLVDERYENERPIVFATNFMPSMWDEMVDARTASRLRGMTVPVQLKGRDRRQTRLGG